MESIIGNIPEMKSIPDSPWKPSMDGGHVRYLNGWLLRMSPVLYADKKYSNGFRKGYRSLIDGIDIKSVRGFKKDVDSMKKKLETLAEYPRTSDNLKKMAALKGSTELSIK